MFNNKTKGFLLLTLLFITILGVSAATAADIDNNAADTSSITQATTTQADLAGDYSVQSDVSNKEKQIVKKTTENVKGDGEGTFTDLETDINKSDVKLAKDYIQGPEESNITITSNKVIDGDGHTITTDKGMFIIENGVTLTVKNLIVSSSHSGNYSNYWYDFYDKGSLILDNVTFNYNSLNRTYGGQIYVDANANLTATDCLFNGENNVRSQIYANGNDFNINIDKSTFTNYNTQYSAIDLNKRGNLTVTNSKFINNIMGENGGAIYINQNGCVALIDNCTFENLTAKYRGGGICANYGNVTVKDSTFKNLVQNATSNNAGSIFVGYAGGTLILENNVMENNTSVNAEVYFNNGKLASDLKMTGENVIADQESTATLELNVTDDNGNPVDFRSSPFVIKIDDETIKTTYKNGTILATFDASYEPGEYNITITYDDTKLLGNVEIPKIKLVVKDIGLLSYANITEMIKSARTGSTVSVTTPVYRKADEESIVISKNDVKLDFNDNTINAKGEKVFDIAEGVNYVTIKNAVVTNIGNSEPSLNNTQGRFITANNTHVILEEVDFINNIATDMSSAPGSFIFAIDSIVEVDECYVYNSSGTFINNVQSGVYITDSVFESNNLYKGYSTNWNALISDGGYLEVRDSVFSNNTPNIAVIDGQSQTLSMFAYGSSLLFNNEELIVDNCIFEDNYASSGKGGAIHTYNDTTVTNSTFLDNKIGGYSNYGGAINSEDGKLTIDECTFLNNAARYTSYGGNDGTAIYNNAGDLSIKNSLIISNITEYAAVYNGASGVSIDINGNYWGNETPEGFYKSTSSGDVMTVDDWVVLNVTVDPKENIKYNDDITVKAFFSKNTDGSQVSTLPDFGMVTFEATGGSLDDSIVVVKDNEATTTLTVKYNPFTVKASYYPDLEAEYTGETVMPEPQVIVLNDGNWTTYFDELGYINDTLVVPNSELRFEGTFTDRFMLIDMPLNLTTAETQAVLNNCSIIVVSDNVNIKNLEMNAQDTEEALITVESASNVNIESNTLTQTNNEDDAETRAIIIDGGSDNVIRNNTITTVGPENTIEYGSDSSINRIYLTSIEANSENLVIDSNKITTKKNDEEAESLGTIFGIYVHGDGSDDYISGVKITNNEFITEGDVYEYAVKLHWLEESLIENNTVTTNSNYFASGIHVFALRDSLIINNTIDNKATNITYGIVLEGAMGGIDWTTYEYIIYNTENTIVSNNTVNVESLFAWAIETYAGIENTIGYNNITVDADLGLGIGLTDQDSVALYNNIQVNAKMTGASQASYDFIDPYTTGVKITDNGLQEVSGNEVSFNNITVNAPAEVPGVNITIGRNTENLITENFIVSPYGFGDEGVTATGTKNIIKNNHPSTLLTDESYDEYFDESCALKPEFNNAEITVSGEFNNHTVFIFDAVNVTLINDGTAVFNNGQVMTGNNATVVLDGMVFNNTVDAVLFESEGNILKNSVINITSDEEIHAITIYDDNSIIESTVINVVAPSANVVYNPDYSVKTPAPTAILIYSNNNIIDDTTIFFDGTSAIHSEDPSAWDAPTVNGIYILSSTTPIENNTIEDTNIDVIGCNYAYGINVGNAKNTQLEEVEVNVESDYYANGIQLFDADTISINGKVNATAETEAYGVYSTAMGTSFSRNIILDELNITVDAPLATGVLIEGSSNVTMTNSAYEISGDEATAISTYIDWMGNTPSNIFIDNLDIKLTGTKENKGTIEAFELESQNNIIKNTIINIDSDYEVYGIYLYNDNNTITNTTINITAPSANVVYNPDYTVKTPAPAAIIINSNNTLIEDTSIFFDGTEAIHSKDPSAWDAPTVNGIYIVSSKTPIENNTITDTSVEVKGCDYAYGINVGNAKNTQLENVDVVVESDYYADAIQLFDADTISINGKVNAAAETEAYGVYSTAMGTSFSRNIDLSDLDVTVVAAKATGVLIEGSSNVTIADASYDIAGAETTAISAYVDWMGNIPTNISIDNLDIDLAGTEENSVLYFGKADTVSITNSEIISRRGSEINFNKTPNSQVVGNYIKINDIIFGDYAVITTENDTIVENNTPTSKKMEEMQETIDELQKELDELKAAKNTTLTLDEITDAKYNGNVTISGTLVNDDSIGLFNQIITLTIGDEEVNVTTKDGVFEYTTLFKEVGEKTVTAKYAGTDKYLESEANMTFTIGKQDIIITYDPIADVAYTDNVTITGKFTQANGKVISNSNVNVYINGKQYKARTDKTGAFSVSAPVKTVGTNNVTLSYGGNTYYNSYETTTTFTTGKQDIVITYDPIADVTYGNNVTITGKFTQANGKAISNSNVNVYINGKQYKARTDSTGAFTLSVRVNAMGTNNVTLSYGGNDYYNSYETSTTFSTDKQDILITYDPIQDTVCGDNVTITGKFTESNGKAISNSNVNVYINGKQYKARTDKTGAFTLSAETKVVGTNNVTLSYGGNACYNSYETSTTFNVIAKAE